MAHNQGTSLVVTDLSPAQKVLHEIPEEEIWLASQKSPRTRTAYRNDVAHFMKTLKITSLKQLRHVQHKEVIAWERSMSEGDKASPSTVRRRLSALSSLFKHLINFGEVKINPVTAVKRPAINRQTGITLAFSKEQARMLLMLPPEDTLQGLRDRAILSVGLQVGLRRAEIVQLTVGDLHENRGYPSLWVVRKGGKREGVAINPMTHQRIKAYLEQCAHKDDLSSPLFLPLVRNAYKKDSSDLSLTPKTVDRILKKYAKQLGLTHGWSAHSMRATFITTALENGASLEDVQRSAGHKDPSTTKLYDRRGYNPEKSATFFANY